MPQPNHIILEIITREIEMKRAILLLAALLATVSCVSTAEADIVVYMDTFADDDIATNPDIGGGFSQFIAGGGTGFTETAGSIVGDSSANNQRAYGFSTNTFDLSNGFELNFIANTTNTSGSSANRFSVGLAEAGADFSTFATNGNNFLSDGATTIEGFGVDFTNNSGIAGLVFNDGEGTLTGLDNEQPITASTDLNVTLTYDAAGNYTYSINGAVASTGTTTLDLTQEYHFATYYQDNVGTPSIREVTLSATAAVPEPSSAALIGLGGLALLLRRKKKNC